MSTDANLDELTVAELDSLLDDLDAERQALRDEARKIMALRNRKIAARELHARTNPTPVMGLPDQGRIERLRVAAGVAEVGTQVKGK